MSVAIVGIGCRFPGGAHSPAQLWNLIKEGRHGIVDVPSERWSLLRHQCDDPDIEGKHRPRRGGFLEVPLDHFDSQFFGLLPREADSLDPQQRLLLEVAWEAFEDAGIPVDSLAGSSTGVYIGGFTLDQMIQQLSPLNRNVVGPNTAAGVSMTMLSNRLSYTFDLRGPSYTVDTACSSSLTAFASAVRDLLEERTEMAVVGGVNAMLRPEFPMVMSRGGFLASDGHCKPFDARANGYGRGEGAGIVVLKPLARAQQDGDRIYAVVEGVGVNQDGRTPGITVPNPDAQNALIRQVYREFQLDPSKVVYVEAHGTGTPVGDPIEAQAIGSFFGQGRHSPLPIGSIKANINHTEAAAGIAGVIKAALLLHHHTVPPLANLQNPNPSIPFETLGLALPREASELEVAQGLVSVNSFGYGGTNAHAVLGSAPATLISSTEDRRTPRPDRSFEDRPFLFPLSARSPQALRDLAGLVSSKLENDPQDSLQVLFHSANSRRSLLEERLLIHSRSREELATSLRRFADTGLEPNCVLGRSLPDLKGPVFVYTGMGPQWWAMGRELLEGNEVVKATAEAIDALFHSKFGVSILSQMLSDEHQSQMARNDIAQPANFLLQAALTSWWTDRGVQPAAIMGHSVGEVTAAWASGALSLEEAVLVSFHRSRIQQQRAGEGTLLAIGMGKDEAGLLLEIYGDDVDIAAINSPTSTALAGPEYVLDEIAAVLTTEGYFAKKLAVEVAYHSRQMDGLEEDVLAALSALQPKTPKIPLYSTVTGELVEEALHTNAYWWQNVRAPVRLQKATEAMLTSGYNLFLEVGPHPVLGHSIKDTAKAQGSHVVLSYSLRRNRSEEKTLFEAAATIKAAGADFSLQPFGPKNDQQEVKKDGEVHGPGDLQKPCLSNTDKETTLEKPPLPFVPLPTYPWQRELHWAESESSRNDRIAEPKHPLLGLPIGGLNHRWRGELSPNFAPYLSDHKVEGAIVVPGALWIETLLAAARELREERAVLLEDFRLLKARTVASGEVVVLETSYQERERRLEIASRSTTGSFILHGSARFSEIDPRETNRFDGPTLEALLSRFEEPEVPTLSGEKLYQRLEQMRLFYGPAFRLVQSVKVLPDGILGNIRVDPQYNTVLAPPVLDAAFQALVSLDRKSSRPMIPVGAARIESLRPLDPDQPLRVLAALTSRQERSLRADLWLLQGPSNEVVAYIKDLRCRAIGSEEHHREPTLFHEVDYPPIQTDLLSESPPQALVILYQSESPADLIEALQKSTPDLEIKAMALESFLSSEFSTSLDLLPEDYELLVDLRAGASENKDARKELHDDGLNDLGAALALVQALSHSREHSSKLPPPERLFFLTSGGGSLHHHRPILPAQAALIGFARVVASEHPELNPAIVDLDPRNPLKGAVEGLQALRGGEEEVFIDADEDRDFVRSFRLQRRPVVPEVAHPTDMNTPFRLEQVGRGSLDSIRFIRSQRRRPGPDEIEVQVRSVPLGFKDALKLLGVLSDDLLEGTFFGEFVGMEGAAEVVAIGENVETYKVGDPVAVISGEGMFHGYLTLPKRQVFPLPTLENATYDELAAQIVVFITSMYGLEDIARVKPNETVLLHSATGGVGLSAIEVARHLGAEVIATAGTEEKRQYLRDLGVRHVFDSRSLSFVDDIKAATGGRGVDVVLNFLTGEMMEQSLSLLAPFGRFIEIGKRDIDANNPLPLRYFNENLLFASVDIDRMIAQRLDLFRTLYDRLMSRFSTRIYKTIPCTFRPLRELSEVLREMMQARHRGKLGVQFTGTIDTIDRGEHRTLYHRDQTYIITGGLGGFGLEVARHLHRGGARSLALLSRRGPSTPGAEEILSSLPGARAFACDVSDYDALKATLQTIRHEMGPLGGIFHAATVLDDGLLQSQTLSRIDRVMAAKARGALYLDSLTREDDLQYFVLFSSISTLVGNPGQAGYAAANALLDALAARRVQEGDPGLSINWGVLGEVGVAARDEHVLGHLEKMGIAPLAPQEALDALEQWLRSDLSNLGVMRVDWSRWAAANPSRAKSSRFTALLKEETQESASAIKELQNLPEEQRATALLEMTILAVAETLRLPTDRLEADRPLESLGVDSLMAVELQTALQLRFGVEISTLELSGSASTTQIAALISTQLDRTD